MRTIEIDIEVHKRIETARRDFSQSENEILRQLLGIESQQNQSVEETTSLQKRSWQGTNQKTGQIVRLEHGTPLRATYGNQEVHGVIDDGKIAVNGKRYAKPSPALIENVTTRAGKRTQLSGWRDWRAQVNGRWVSLTNL